MNPTTLESITKASHDAEFLCSDLVAALGTADAITGLILYKMAENAANLRDSVKRLLAAAEANDPR